MSAACVWRLEAILDLSAELYNPLSPVVCCDGSPYPLGSARRPPRPVAPGPPLRYDDEERREGTCPVCMCFEPRQGWRPRTVTDRRTTQDVAHGMTDLVESQFPTAAVISVASDHLNTHPPGALEATFPPANACRS